MIPWWLRSLRLSIKHLDCNVLIGFLLTAFPTSCSWDHRQQFAVVALDFGGEKRLVWLLSHISCRFCCELACCLVLLTHCDQLTFFVLERGWGMRLARRNAAITCNKVNVLFIGSKLLKHLSTVWLATCGLGFGLLGAARFIVCRRWRFNRQFLLVCQTYRGNWVV